MNVLFGPDSREDADVLIVDDNKSDSIFLSELIGNSTEYGGKKLLQTYSFEEPHFIRKIPAGLLFSGLLYARC